MLHESREKASFFFGVGWGSKMQIHAMVRLKQYGRPDEEPAFVQWSFTGRFRICQGHSRS